MDSARIGHEASGEERRLFGMPVVHLLVTLGATIMCIACLMLAEQRVAASILQGAVWGLMSLGLLYVMRNYLVFPFDDERRWLAWLAHFVMPLLFLMNDWS